MRSALAIGLALLGSTSALAADVGIGVSAKSNDAWIYVPIDFGDRFRIEPSVRFSSNESESTATSDSFFPVTSTYNSDSDQKELALGLFGLTSVHESARLYYGVRVAYVDAELKTVATTRFPTFVDVDRETQSQDGYRLSPTLGFEYLIGKHFAIGGEAEWFYLDLDGEYKSSNNSLTAPATRFSRKTNGTDTRLVLRYRF